MDIVGAFVGVYRLEMDSLAGMSINPRPLTESDAHAAG